MQALQIPIHTHNTPRTPPGHKRLSVLLYCHGISIEMVNLTVALFAQFRVNGKVFDILEEGEMTPNIII